VAASGQGDDDPLQESRAYNQSIYLFVTMPYLSLGGFGLLVYWNMRRARRGAALAGKLSRGDDSGGPWALPPGAAPAGGSSDGITTEPTAIRGPGPFGGGPGGAD
jgi:hypothetical protein